MRRVPLWATLVPLIVGLAIYWWYWDREHDAFKQALTETFGTQVAVGGFPYRLEAEIADPRISHNGSYVFDARAERLRANRQPWRAALTSVGLLKPRVTWWIPSIDGTAFSVTSATAQTSLRLDGDRIVRLSSVHDDARIGLPLLPVPTTATSFEWHFRETPAAPDPASRAPTFPEQAQLVLAGDGFRIGGGDPLRMTAQIGVTSAAPVWDLTSWRRGGTVELHSLTLADTHGDILTLKATGSAGSAGPLRLAGTIDTVCPASVTAAFAGT
ncbi:MAG: DUF2125 domain-containing protein, partial [Sphingomonadaceae bacterium]|nr:DUF2125 domain-containing protein [Sphingomonadaceae bacterium]